MPSQPAWFHRLDEILGALRSMTSTRLDRAAVEKLFRVRQRRARQIMAGLEGLRVGNAAAVSREALIARLERTAAAGVLPSPHFAAISCWLSKSWWHYPPGTGSAQLLASLFREQVFGGGREGRRVL